jgi:hypothetical protein
MAAPIPAAMGGPVASGAGPDAAPAARRIAVIPFAPRGAKPEAWDDLWPFIARSLADRGLEVVESVAVERQMRTARLRDASILSHEEISALAAAVRADRVLLGNLYRLDDGKEPRVSFSGRILNPEKLEIEAMSVTLLEGNALLGPLGMGGPVTEERLLEEAARRFAASLDDGLHGVPPLQEIKPLLRGGMLAPGAASYMAPQINARGIRRVTVLPFRNQTKHLGAGQAAADMFAWCLMASGQVSLFDSGDAARRLLVRGWRTGMPVGRAEVLALGGDPGVDAVLMGSVDRWSGVDQGGSIPPEVAFTLRLLDAKTGEILWAAEQERRGDQTTMIYGIGGARLTESLLARSALEAVQPLLKAMKVSTRPSNGEARK